MDLLLFLLPHASPLIWESSHFHLDPAMFSRLLRLASLCLLGARYISAEVAQSPSHRVIEKKQAVNLSCDPISGHNSLFWYYHAVGTEMKLLVYFLRESVQDNSGMPKGRFTAERTEGTSSTLRVHSAELGHVGAMVIQNPRYLVTGLGKPVTLNCSQNMKHDAMYWYQQKPSQAPKLLLYYYDKEITREKNTSENFQSSQPNTSLCSLDIRSAGLGDSAVYLCASSRDTELKPSLPSVHKPLFPRAKSPL
ncbi:hypothetical protein MJT46_006259 [Ovis ammon polii x Ovis aries]|nr:hypothetical protein MJT46_006259 [Ovis ammon polii x Ovis aries]